MNEATEIESNAEPAGQNERLVIYRQRYEIDFSWRKAWNDLANNIKRRRSKYPLQKQQEYIEYRARLANSRIAKLMHKFDLGI